MWASSSRASRPRAVFLRPAAPDVPAHTDATASTRIVAAVVIPVVNGLATGDCDRRRDDVTDPQRGGVFIWDTYIYGLEMLDILATNLPQEKFLRAKTRPAILITETPAML